MLPCKFQSTLRFIGTLSIAVALFSLCGGHWALLQGVAWSRMIQTYSTQGSFQSAVEKTFDGKHPCSLCKKIQQAKQQEKKNSFVNDTFKKKEAVLEQPFLLPPFFGTYFRYTHSNKQNVAIRATKPPSPPPRRIS